MLRSKSASNMHDGRFYALEGDLVHSDPGDYLQSVFLKYKIPFVHQNVAMLTDHNRSEWPRDSICVLDYHHWGYADAVFREYLDSLSRSGVEVVRFSDRPFDYEMQRLDMQQRIELLINRTKIARSEFPGKLVSPAISVMPEQTEKYFKLYWRECSSLFDVYSVACDIEGTERQIAVLVGMLAHAMRAPKDVWITDWRVPCCDDPVEPAILGSTVTIQSSKVAAARMKNVFQAVNAVAPSARWYITSAGRDFYSPSNRPGSFVYHWPFASTDEWGNQNFTGLRAWDGMPKFRIVQSLIEIVQNHG
jgi:hypothetical protein